MQPPDPTTTEAPALPDIDGLWTYSDPAATEARFRDVLPRAEAAAADPAVRAYHLELLAQLARALCLQRRYDETHDTLDRVKQALAAAGAPDLPRVRARYCLERGRTFNDTRRFDEAKACFREAWDAARANGEDFLAVDAAHMFGVMGPPDEAVAWNLTALEYAAASPDPKARRWEGTLRNNLGWTYHKLGRFEDALRVFREVAAIHERDGRADRLQIARYSVAKTLRLMGRVPEAMTMQEALLRQCEEAGTPDGYVHEEVGECLLALGRADEARPHFARAYELLSNDPWFPPPEAERLERMRALGGNG